MTIEVRILSENRLSHAAYYRKDAKISEPVRKVSMFLQKPQIKVTQAWEKRVINIFIFL